MFKYFMIIALFFGTLFQGLSANIAPKVASPKIIAIDLHGVLVDYSKWSIADYLGKMNLFWYGGDIEKRFSEFLQLAELSTDKDCLIKVNDQMKPMPKIMVEWQRGHKTSAEVLKYFKDLVEKNKSFFKSDLERQLIVSLLDGMSPQNLCDLVSPIDSMVKLIENYKFNLNSDHKIIILTNWDKESFDLVRKDKKFKRIFDCFDEDSIIISSQVNKVKPQKDMFDLIVSKFNVKPEDVIIIDDQEYIINAAKEHGFNTIHHKDHSSTKKALDSHNLLK